MSHEKRKYELRKRAEAMDETRRRITEAAVELHGTVGPARTTISAVAERAGVQRHTVYRHFPTEKDLFAACSSHFRATHPWPDAHSWEAIEDPRERLSRALDELYRYYEDTGHMYANVNRDVELVPSIRGANEPLLAYLEHAIRVLSAGWPARKLLTGALRHVTAFATWRSLTRDGGLSRPQAVRLALAMVEEAALSRSRRAA